MLDLQDITLCAVDCVTPGLAAKALDRSMAQCRFGQALLLSHEPAPTRAQWRRIDRLASIDAYSQFVIHQLGHYIETPYVLIVQWDGFVVDAKAWDPTFLSWDYIGAPWPWHDGGMDVGNGGFSLRSRRLLQALADPEFVNVADEPEDVLICQRNRAFLETRHGIRFAPASVATRFSHECSPPEGATFGFHGFFNINRYMQDDEVLQTLAQLHPGACLSPGGITMQMDYLRRRHYDMAREMFRLMKESADDEAIVQAYRRVLTEPGSAETMLGIGNTLLASQAQWSQPSCAAPP